MTTTIPQNEVKPGDILVALDGHTLPRGVKVTEVVSHDADGTLHVRVEQPKGFVSTPDRYLRHGEVTVERLKPIIEGLPEGYEIRTPGKVSQATLARPWAWTWERAADILETASKGKPGGWVTLAEWRAVEGNVLPASGHEASPVTNALERRGVIQIAVRKNRPNLYRLTYR